MTDTEVVIHGVALTEDGLAINYSRVPADIRKNGLLWDHTVLVPAGSDYDDEIETFSEALRALLDDVLEDEATAEVVELVEEEDDDGDE